MSIFSPRVIDRIVDLERFYTFDVFPDLAKTFAVAVNLDALARALRPRSEGPNPFLDPDKLDRLLRRLCYRWGVDYTFGGYVEDRRTLWRGSYLNQDAALHLGIDINVAAGTRMCSAHNATLVVSTHDHNQDGGWGGVAIVELDEPVENITHVLYAHLSCGGVRRTVGDRIRAGEAFAQVGRSHENGGWYEHVHIQAMTAEAWRQTQGDLDSFDGYAATSFADGHPLFPDPWPVIGGANIRKRELNV